MSSTISVSVADIKDARKRIEKYVNLTPCTYSPNLSGELGCELFFKMENLQRTGAYKDRGAMNAVLCLDDAQKKAGVIAASAGNHAQGLAFAAQRSNVHATIVMPETAPMAIADAMDSQLSGSAPRRASHSVATSAMSMPIMPRLLPSFAVSCFESPASDRMKSSPATM